MEQSKSNPNGFGVTALVVGIIAFLLGWTGLLGLILAIVAVVFGILALVKKQSKGMGITGIVLGSLALVTALFVTTVGLAILSGVAQSNNSSDNNTSKDSTSEVKSSYKVGEAVNIDDRTLVVDKVERNYSTGNEFSQPESGKEFVVVSVTIKNNGSDPVSFNTFDFKMQDSNGVQLDEAFVALSEGKLNSGSLAPGGTVTGKLVYQVPKDDADLKLLFTNPNLFNSKQITFDLQ